MQRIKQFIGTLVGIALVVGLKFWNKSSSHDDIKKDLIGKCAKDKACIVAVKKHFDECFDANYDLGGRRRSSGLKTAEFLACFNEKSGVEHFTLAH